MRVKDYSTLKAASKVSFAKATVNGEEIVQLTEKRFNPATGGASSDIVREVSVSDYTSEKLSLESEKAILETDIAELEKIITDIEAL